MYMDVFDNMWRDFKRWLVMAILLLGAVLCLIYALGCDLPPLLEVNYYYESIYHVEVPT